MGHSLAAWTQTALDQPRKPRSVAIVDACGSRLMVRQFSVAVECINSRLLTFPMTSVRRQLGKVHWCSFDDVVDGRNFSLHRMVNCLPLTTASIVCGYSVLMVTHCCEAGMLMAPAMACSWPPVRSRLPAPSCSCGTVVRVCKCCVSTVCQQNAGTMHQSLCLL